MDEINEKEKKLNTGTTVILDENSYALIREKQMEIFNVDKRKVTIQELVSNSIKQGINLVKI